MYSQLDICNRAMRLLGEPILVSLADQTKAAEECKFLYPIVKREVLASYPWKCAERVVTLNSIMAEQNNGNDSSTYKYKFLLPYDCVAVLACNDTNSFNKDGLYLYSDSAIAKVRYTANIEEKLLTLRVAKAIAFQLALELSYSLLGDGSVTAKINALVETEMRKLAQLDTQEGSCKSAEKIIDADTSSNWLTSRL